MSQSIHQELQFKAAPQRIYEALLDSGQFSQLSGGAPAEIEKSAGGAFSTFGGMITGRNVELKPNQRIVQAWRAGNWPEGIYSMVRFELHPQGSGTRLTFDQSGFPDDSREHLEGGWQKMYWDPLREFLT